VVVVMSCKCSVIQQMRGLGVEHAEGLDHVTLVEQYQRNFFSNMISAISYITRISLVKINLTQL
jgi:hypothetical protein